MMKKTTPRSKNISNDKWITYSGVAAAFLAAASDADAQIVFTDVNPDSTLVNTNFDIDFDGDGNVDITISHIISTSGNIQIAGVNVPSGAAVVGVISNSFLYPNIIANGAAIDPSDPSWQTQTFGSLFYAYNGGGYGQWNGQSGYLGVRFTDGGGMTHYAWVELDVPNNATAATVRGYAYETTPDMAIAAGDEGSSTAFNEVGANALTADVFPNPVVDQLKVKFSAAIQGAVDVRIFDGNGRVVFVQQGTIDRADGMLTMDLKTLPAGAYVAEVLGDDQIVRSTFVKEGR